MPRHGLRQKEAEKKYCNIQYQVPVPGSMLWHSPSMYGTCTMYRYVCNVSIPVSRDRYWNIAIWHTGTGNITILLPVSIQVSPETVPVFKPTDDVQVCPCIEYVCMVVHSTYIMASDEYTTPGTMDCMTDGIGIEMLEWYPLDSRYSPHVTRHVTLATGPMRLRILAFTFENRRRQKKLLINPTWLLPRR